MSKKLLLKSLQRRVLKVGVRLANKRPTTPAQLVTFSQLHGEVVETAINLQRSHVSRLHDAPKTVTYQQVAALRERLAGFTSSLR